MSGPRDWPLLKHVARYYTAHPWFSPKPPEPGMSFLDMLVDRPDNAEESRRLDGKLIAVLEGEALSPFRGRVLEEKYLFKGFTKLRILHQMYDEQSEQLAAADMVEFMTAFDQGDRTVVQYQQDLDSRIADIEALGDCSFPRLLTFGLMVRGLREGPRAEIISALRSKRLSIRTATTKDLALFLKDFSDEGWITLEGHGRRRAPSASQATTEGGGGGGGGGAKGDKPKDTGKDKDGKVYTSPFPWIAALPDKRIISATKNKKHCGHCHREVGKDCENGFLDCTILKRAGFKVVKLDKSKKNKDKGTGKDAAAASVANDDDDVAPAASAVSVDPSEDTADSYQWDGAEPVSGGDVPASAFMGGPEASAVDFPPLSGGG